MLVSSYCEYDEQLKNVKQTCFLESCSSLLQELLENEKNHLVVLAHQFGGTSLFSHTKICTNPKTPIMHLQMHTRHIMYAFLMENLEIFLELEKTFKPQAQTDLFHKFLNCL